MRVVNKKRFGIFVAVVVLLTIALLFVVANATDKPDVVCYDTYVVSNGDTLWDIADTSNGYDYVDTREIVYTIRTASGLDTADVYVGDIVLVPVYNVKGDR